MAIAGDRVESDTEWSDTSMAREESQERIIHQLTNVLAKTVHDVDEARILAMRAGFPREFLPELHTARAFWASVVEQAMNGMVPPDALIAAALRRYPGWHPELRAISTRIEEGAATSITKVLSPVRQLASGERLRNRLILLLAALSTATALLSLYTLTSAESIYITYASAMAAVVALVAYLSRSSALMLRRIATTLIDATRSSWKLETLPSLHTHRSIHHLFGERERLLPVKGQGVDLALDAADLPEGLLPYLELLSRNGTEARVLLLDPDSPLVSRHRFSVTERPDVNQSATESIRAKMRKAVDLTKKCANVRLYDAVPLGNLVMVGDRIYWGGIPSVPTDVPLPVVEMTADVRGDLFWSYRRNFDCLWDSAKPVQSVQASISDAVVRAHAET